MPILVNIKSKILSNMTNNDSIQVTIVDYLLNRQVYHKKVLLQVIKLYPQYELEIRNLFNSKNIKYRNIIKNTNNWIIQCDLFIDI